MKEKLVSVFTLFGSFTTILCCVVPALIAAVAGGAAVVSFITVFPWVIPLSQYKGWLFLIAGVLIVIDWVLVFTPQSTLACKITGGSGCEITSKFSKTVLVISVGLYVLGLFFAYLLVPIMEMLGVGA